MNPRLVFFGTLVVAMASCTQPEEIRLHNYSEDQIDVRLGGESNLLDPGENLQFSVLSYGNLAIVVNGQRLRYEPQFWDLNYVHQTRCGWTSCRVVYFRFDDDRKIRILHPERRDDTQMPLTQPDGFPLDPVAS